MTGNVSNPDAHPPGIQDSPRPAAPSEAPGIAGLRAEILQALLDGDYEDITDFED